MRLLQEQDEDKEDLRKTARGASSPAKPALHIPELQDSLAKPRHIVFTENARYQDGIPKAAPLLRSSLVVGNMGAYPLSMTRAATSSVEGR